MLIAELQVELQTDTKENENENLFTLTFSDYTVILQSIMYFICTVNFVYPSIFTTLAGSGFKAALCRIYL